MARPLFSRVMVLVLVAVSGCEQGSSPGASKGGERAVNRQALMVPIEPVDREVALTAYRDFRQWLTTYGNAEPSKRASLEAQGALLAQARRPGARWLMLNDPELAIALAVNPVERAQLPASVAALVEQWRDGLGTLHVIGGLGADGTPLAVQKSVTFNDAPDEFLQAGLYGGRALQTTRENIRLHGVALDGVVAVLDSRLRKLFPGETSRVGPIERPRACPVSKLDAEPALVFDGGDTLFGFCQLAHATQHEQALTSQEDAQQALNGFGTLAWSTGVKKILVIRLDFSDKPGDPVSESSITSMMNTTVNNFYKAASYNQTSIVATITPTLRLPKTQAAYAAANDSNGLLNDGRAAAKAAGFDYTTYDFDIVGFVATFGGGWAGQAYIGSKGLWLNGYFDLRVIGHELGHNLGVYHANYWNASGLTIIGPGVNVEYGNPFDMMSSGGNASTHFNAWFKRTFDWIPTQDVAVVTTSGTYRMTTLEQALTSGYHAIKVPRDSNKDYWLEFRTGISNTYLQNGASVNWGYKYNSGSHLLDMTPGDNDKNNSPLLIGRTFSDTFAGIHLTPVGKGGTTPETLDVVVNLGTFPGNRPPVATLSASTTTPTVGQSVTFNTTASDPDGDALAYAWTFDDGSFGPNASTATKSFSTARDYNVLLTVSDMKGQIVTKSLVITVGTPTTYTLSGHVLDGTNGVAGVRISDGTRATYSASDGSWALTNVPAGSFTITAAKVDYTFIAGFSSPLAVAAAQGGLDFTASAVPGYQVTGKVTSSGTGVAGVQVTDGSRVATTNSTGDYTLSPVPSGRYTVTATKPGWVFTPSFVQPLDVIGGNVALTNFYASGAGVSGTVPTAGVATAPQVTDGVRVATATMSGTTWYWNLYGLSNGTWNITATSPGVTLVPDFVNPITVSGGVGPYNLTFHVASTAGVQVSGTITTGSTPLPGVVVSDGTRTSKTDGQGRYVLIGVPAGPSTLTPTLAGYTFVPASRSVTVASAAITGQDFATTVVNLPPTVATAASATPNPVTTGTSTTLSVLGADDAAESTLTYTWSASPSGYPVSFSANGTNAAKNTTATFTGATTYTLECLIADSGGLSVRSSTVVAVQSVPTSMVLAPATGSLLTNATLNLQAKLKDQFGNQVYIGTPTWVVTGPAALSVSTGWSTVLTAGATAGTAVATATVSSKSASATVSITTPATPVITTAASASPSPVTAKTTTLSVRASDDGGEPALTYTWASTAGPAPVVLAATNGTNAAKDLLATFAKVGDYSFSVTVKDVDGNTNTSAVNVKVTPTASKIDIQPAVATLQVKQTQTFLVTVSDQFGDALAVQPTVTWALSGGGSVDATGLFTAGTVAGGPFTLTATSGALMVTATITLGEAPDTTPPTVALTSPAANEHVTGGLHLVATASDNVAVTKVEFWLDGTTKLGEATAAPWELTVDSTTIADGVHTLTAKAFDAAGNSATSDTVSVTVGNAPVDQLPPQVSITDPLANASTALSVPVAVTASDDIGVTQVQLEVDGQVVKTLSAPPWAASIDVSPGSHTLVALAFDASAKFTRSDAVTFIAGGPDAGSAGGGAGGAGGGSGSTGGGVGSEGTGGGTSAASEPIIGACGCSNVNGSSLSSLLVGLVALTWRRGRSRRLNQNKVSEL